MPRTGLGLVNGQARRAGDGSVVGATPDGQITPVGPVYKTDNGVGLGPIVFEPYADNVLAFEEFTFPIPADDGGWFDNLLALSATAGIAAVGAPDTEAVEESEKRVSRRDVLKMGAAAGGLLAASGTATAADDTETLTIAEGTIAQTPGFRIRIADVVPDVMTMGNTYYAEVDDTEVASFENGGGVATISPKYDGDISIHTDADRDFGARISGTLANDEHRYEFDLAEHDVVAESATDLASGDIVELTTEPHVIGPLREAEDSSSKMTIGGTSIPHTEESDDPVGEYRIQNNTLIYIAGGSPPDATEVEIVIDIGVAAEAMDDTSRSV